MTKEELEEKQQLFLDVLFEEANGDAEVAKKLAGFDDKTPVGVILKSMQDRIPEATKAFLSTKGQIKAVWAFVRALEEPSELGMKEKLLAAKEILDRTGLVKGEKIEVKTENPIFILPPKKEDED